MNYAPLSVGEIAGIVICALELVTVFVLVGIIVYRKTHGWDFRCIKGYEPESSGHEPESSGHEPESSRHKKESSKHEPESSRHEPESSCHEPRIDNRRSAISRASLKVRKSVRKRPIVLNAIGELLRRYHADNNKRFIRDYKDLKQSSPKHKTNAAKLDKNKRKNRYTNILPYDHSRVILTTMVDKEDSSDYINANYIPGYTHGKEFIASQGPLPSTLNDFWRMIWEQSVSIIVMLTKCSVKNKDKCVHYWPHAANEPKCYNDLMVNVTSVSNMGKYDIHIIEVCLGDEKREITHFQYLEWPDFSANVETTALLDFIATVRQQITPYIKSPTVIHCSAGVGRTGTFITVDYLMQYVEDHDLSSQVDIFDWVLQMRDHRTTMVQTWTQYAFIHDCLSEIVERKKRLQSPEVNGEVAIDNVASENDNVYENTKRFQLEL